MDQQVKMLRMDEISEGPYHVRAEEKDEAIAELAASISRVGILNPLRVCAEGDGYLLIAGHRRLSAAKIAGLGQVPCIVSQARGAQAREVSIAENFFRKDLSPIEQASAINDCVNDGVMDIEQIAAAMNRQPAWIEDQLSLLEWPDDVISALHMGVISVSAARNLALIADDTYRLTLLNMALENGATARTTAAWLQAWRAAKPASEAAAAGPVSPGSASPTVASYLICVGCQNEFLPGQIPFVPLCSNCGGILHEGFARAQIDGPG